MAVFRRTSRSRREAVLSELAKLEQELREKGDRCVRLAHEHRLAGRHSDRAYWSGVGEGHRHSAEAVAEAYHRVLEIYGGEWQR